MTLADDIKISVVTQPLENQSVPAENRYAFAYTIHMRNLSHYTVQLRNRYWQITNGNNKSHEVSGAGVVGEEPILEPNGEYTYTSGAVLDTPVGSMQGHFEFEDPSGKMFLVPVPIFSFMKANSVN